MNENFFKIIRFHASLSLRGNRNLERRVERKQLNSNNFSHTQLIHMQQSLLKSDTVKQSKKSCSINFHEGIRL